MHGFFAWIQDAAKWLLELARTYPESAFAIASISAFGESFVGVSFLVPGTTILVGLGVLIQALGLNPVPIWLGAAAGAILVVAWENGEREYRLSLRERTSEAGACPS